MSSGCANVEQYTNVLYLKQVNKSSENSELQHKHITCLCTGKKLLNLILQQG